MSPAIHAMTHGTRGLELAYMVVLAGMLAGCIRAHADWRKLLLVPLLAAPMTVLAGILTAVAVPLLRIFDIDPTGLLRLLFGTALTAAFAYIAGRFLAAHRASGDAEHRRGAKVLTTPTSSSARITAITLAEVSVPLEDEAKHFKLIGTTGTGKSTAIRELLTAALRRGDRAVIADPDNGYLNHFYDPDRGDVILNPFDPAARKWNPFGEIINDYDIEQLARSLIPDGGDSDRIWFEYARTFFSEVMRQCIRVGARDDAQLFRLLTAASDKELRTMLAGTAAGPFLEVGNEKMFGSLRSVASSAVRALAHTTRQEAEPFSVRQWIREGGAQPGGAGGVLFLPYSAGQIAALRSVISAWMRLAIFEAMDRPEADQRLWFVVDELDALGEIDGLKDALARLRKFGGRCVLGFQSIAQVSGTYGKGAAETLVENCANTLILRCSASEHGGTSEFASKLIGQREVLHTTRSRTRRPLHWLASTTTSQHLKIEPAVMASEIERLPDLAGFLKLASCPDWQSVTLRPRAPRPGAAVPPPRGPAPHTTASTSPTPAAGTPATASAPPIPAADTPPVGRGSTTQSTPAPTSAVAAVQNRTRTRSARTPSPTVAMSKSYVQSKKSVRHGTPASSADPAASSTAPQAPTTATSDAIDSVRTRPDGAQSSQPPL